MALITCARLLRVVCFLSSMCWLSNRGGGVHRVEARHIAEEGL